MKMIEYGDAQAGYDNRPASATAGLMRECIWNWTDGLCPLGRLDNGEEVPAKTVMKYARKIDSSIVEGSMFFSQKPALQAVAEYCEKVALREAAHNALVKAAKAYHAAGMRYRDWSEDARNIGSQEIYSKETE